MDEKSITAIKAAFIRSQVRQLLTPLEPTTQWRDLAPAPEDGHLSDKNIRDIVSKVNEKVKQHNRMVYSQQSQRHVAEQIESLHWNLATADSDRAELDTVVVRRDAELTDRSTIESLPEDYDDLHLHPDHETAGEDADKYNDLRAHLLELSRARDVLKQKLAQYRHLRTLLEPLDNPQANIQPNLVTRDGELSVELDRMRILLARVTGRVSDMPQTRKMRPDTVPTDQQKLASLMEWT